MNKKLIFRILGAISSAMIIAAVVVPFMNASGYTASLWKIYENANSIYLPIMIIVFGAIGVIFFALNIKTEFAYMSTGAIAFFIVIETINALNNGSFNTLYIGYYLLIAGAILTGLMAFLTNLKPKTSNETIVSTNSLPNNMSVTEQMDMLYNNNAMPEISPVQPIMPNVIPEPQPVNPTVNEFGNAPVQPSIPNTIPEPQPVNPTVSEFGNAPVQPNIPNVVPEPQPVNPVVSEFGNTPVQANIPNVVPEPQPVNPVVSEFENNPVQSQNQFINPSAPAPAPSNTNQVNNGISAVDIFGQSIN